jgi:hypothetical protein
MATSCMEGLSTVEGVGAHKVVSEIVKQVVVPSIAPETRLPETRWQAGRLPPS